MKTTHCWLIHDGAAGNRYQARALAKALDWSFDEKIIQPTGLTRWLAPRLSPFGKTSLGSDFRNPPPYVIGCGRQAALTTRLLKQCGSCAIQILDPRLASKHWDVVIAPMHDKVPGENVIHTLGSLHDISSECLVAARSQTSPLSSLNSPPTLVLIGGPSRMALFNEGLIEVMFSHLEYNLAKQGGSLIICGSRRTPKLIAEKIRQRFSESGFPVWFDESDGENFYRAALSHADRIALTPDSVNMISEACATSLPVFIAQPERASGRMQLFLDALKSKGRIETLKRGSKDFPVDALNTMPELARQLRSFLGAP